MLPQRIPLQIQLLVIGADPGISKEPSLPSLRGLSRHTVCPVFTRPNWIYGTLIYEMGKIDKNGAESTPFSRAVSCVIKRPFDDTPTRTLPLPSSTQHPDRQMAAHDRNSGARPFRPIGPASQKRADIVGEFPFGCLNRLRTKETRDSRV